MADKPIVHYNKRGIKMQEYKGVIELQWRNPDKSVATKAIPEVVWDEMAEKKAKAKESK